MAVNTSRFDEKEDPWGVLAASQNTVPGQAGPPLKMPMNHTSLAARQIERIE